VLFAKGSSTVSPPNLVNSPTFLLTSVADIYIICSKLPFVALDQKTVQMQLIFHLIPLKKCVRHHLSFHQDESKVPRRINLRLIYKFVIRMIDVFHRQQPSAIHFWQPYYHPYFLAIWVLYEKHKLLLLKAIV
jgi:hypothetical protein